MSHLRSKSEINLAAAELLIDTSYYAPSVHCSYYGCFQFIKSKLNQIGIFYDKIDQDIASTPTLSSHNYPIRLILNEIEQKKDRYYKRSVKDKINDLKAFREESDYHNIDIKYPESIKAFNLSKEIIKLIKSSL